MWRDPIAISWRGNVVYTAPPPSSGGVALAQLLGIKEDRAADFKGVEHNSAKYIHLLAEIEKRVFADRADYLGDPGFTKVPVDQLMAKDYKFSHPQIQAMPWGSQDMTIADPFGNRLVFTNAISV